MNKNLDDFFADDTFENDHEMNVNNFSDSDDPEYFLEMNENQKLLLANSFLLISFEIIGPKLYFELP